MWLKEAIEARHFEGIIKRFVKASECFTLKNEVQSFPSKLNRSRFHLVGYVETSYVRDYEHYVVLASGKHPKLAVRVPPCSTDDGYRGQYVVCKDVWEDFHMLNNYNGDFRCNEVVIL